MTRGALVYCPFSDWIEASKIARAMVEEGHAACANVMAPVRSIYSWDGAINEAEEVPVIFKVAANRAPALTARIAELHRYDNPAIVTLPIEHAPQPFLDWLDETRPE